MTTVYDDYMYSGNQNFYSDLARAQRLLSHRPSYDDYLSAGYPDAHSRVMNDDALVREFFGAGKQIGYPPHYDHNSTSNAQIPSEKELNRQTAIDKRVKTHKTKKDKLIQQATAMSKVIDPVTNRQQIDQWRIDNGYLWEVVSPKGTLFREVIKNVTIENEKDYTIFHAMKISFSENTGLAY